MSEALSISKAKTDSHVFSEAPAYDVMAPDSGPEFAFAEDQVPFQHPSSTIDDLPTPPAGWAWVDKVWLEQQRQPLDDNELGRFFDGVLPQWRHALSDKIPRRDVVLEASALLQGAAAEPGRPRVIFLEGAGGEGKSTAFRQIVAQLLEDDPRWVVLWRENDLDSTVLPKGIIGGLSKVGRPILIATDEAHNIARNLLAFVEETRSRDVGGVHVPKLDSWRFGIVNQMLKERRLDQAVRLVRRLVELESDNIHYLVNLARTLREIGDVEAAFGVFRSAQDAFAHDRFFYSEWGTAAGNAGDYALNVWLAGVSLSDADGLPQLGAQQIRFVLAGLGVACKELYATSRERTFLRARAAAGQLGLRIPGRDVERGYFLRHRDEAEAEGIEAMSVDAAVRAIEEAVFRAFDLSDVAEELSDEGVPHRDEVIFKSLRDLP